MGLLELLKGERQKAHKSKAGLWSEYRQILLRRGKAAPADAKRIAELCEELGIDDRHVAMHAWLLDQAASLEVEAEAGEAARAEKKKLEERLAPLYQQIGEIRAQIEKITEGHDAEQAHQRMFRGEQASAERESFVRRYPWLLAGDTESKPMPGIFGGAGVQDMLNTLGLEGDLDGQYLPPNMTKLETFRLYHAGYPVGESLDAPVASDAGASQ